MSAPELPPPLDPLALDRDEQVIVALCELKAQGDRIEAQLAALLNALAEDEEEDGPTHDLEGFELPPDRDENDEL